MLSKSFPHSPDLENIPNGFAKMGALFERNSPLSALSHEFDSSLLIGEYSRANYRLESKTPRRSLISQLATVSATPGSSMKDSRMACDSPFNSSPKSQKNGGSEVILAKQEMPRFSLSSPLKHEPDSESCGASGSRTDGSADSDLDSLHSLCSSDDQVDNHAEFHGKKDSIFGANVALANKPEAENPFVPSSDRVDAPTFVKDPAILFKTSLKFRDQNDGKFVRPRPGKPFSGNKLSHWNQREPVARPNAFTRHKTINLTKKREIDFQSPESSSHAVFAPGRISGPSNPPRKIRRALTFNGDATKKQSHPPSSQTGDHFDTFKQQDPTLPSFLEDGKDMIRRITPATLVNLLDGKYLGSNDKLHLIDCRYPFEYQGGHIKGAINITSTETIQNMFFTNHPSGSSKTIIIFHCEYSCQRAPKMALYFRGLDRNQNKDSYPKLDYPDIYILQGGYRDFYHINKVRCEPEGYIEMNDVKYKDECNRGIMQQKKQFPNFSKDGFLR